MLELQYSQKVIMDYLPGNTNNNFNTPAIIKSTLSHLQKWYKFKMNVPTNYL